MFIECSKVKSDPTAFAGFTSAIGNGLLWGNLSAEEFAALPDGGCAVEFCHAWFDTWQPLDCPQRQGQTAAE